MRDLLPSGAADIGHDRLDAATTARDLVVIGAGGHGRETLDVIEAANGLRANHRFVGFVDDGRLGAEAEARLARRGGRLLGPVAILEALDIAYVIGIGDGGIRARLDRRLTAWGREAATLVHPLASVGSDSRLSPGVVLAAGARITTNVTLGRHVHCNVNAVVSHDCTVGDHSTLSPGVHLNGEVQVGTRVFLGTGVIVLPGVEIGDDARVGAGAVVVRDVPPKTTVMGVPAR